MTTAVLPVPTTWAGHRTYAARALLVPETPEDLAAIVTSGEPVRAVGSRHSFNDLVDSPGVLVSLSRLERKPVLGTPDETPEETPDEASDETSLGGPTVTVTAGTTYGTLGPWLDERGFALAALASLPHISVVGAVTTATHGSGDDIRTLAGAVVGLEILRADGSVHRVRRGDADFPGAVVSLGGLGIVLSVTLAVEPRYQVRQTVLEDVPLDAILADLGRVHASATSVSVFTRWDGRSAIWRKQRTDDGVGRLPADLADLGGRPATEPRHPLPSGDAGACTEQLDVPGPWYERLPHFRLAFTPSAGAELQSEYLLPRESAAAAIRAAQPLLERARDLVLVSELRSMAADDLWLSGAFGRDTVGLHTTWVQDVPAVTSLLPELERALAPFGARPHWGKLFTTDAETLTGLYPRFGDARALLHRWDPDGVFSGPLLARVGLR